MIALEPEAAAIFCQEKNLSDFYSETGRRSVDGILSQPNTNYMVIDIGGNLFYFIFLHDLNVCLNGLIRPKSVANLCTLTVRLLEPKYTHMEEDGPKQHFSNAKDYSQLRSFTNGPIKFRVH